MDAAFSKQAVVREELVVRKDVEQRTERIAGTLRRTEVDVEEGAGDHSAFCSFGGGEGGTTASDSDKADFDRDRPR